MKLSLFSISYAGLWGQDSLSLTDFISKAAALGYDSVTLAAKRPHLSVLDWDEERLAKLRTALGECSITCDVLAAYTDFGGTVAAEVPYTEMQIAWLEQICRLAKSIGASILRVFTSYEVPGQSPHATWQQTVRCLQELCDRAADFDVTIAVQNHHDIAVHSDALLELLSDVDRGNCKAGFDAWSPALRGEALFEAARKLAPVTAITTNADYVRLPRFQYEPNVINYRPVTPDLVRAVPFGTGFIDYEAFFNGLREGGFDGIATYEMCSPVRGGGSMQNLDDYATAFVSWMSERRFRAT